MDVAVGEELYPLDAPRLRALSGILLSLHILLSLQPPPLG
jgi:hypothetical protein